MKNFIKVFSNSYYRLLGGLKFFQEKNKAEAI